MNQDLNADDLKAKTIRGGVSRVGAQCANFGLRLGSLAVLARLLEPADFGLISMVNVATGVFVLFKDAGLSMVTIQRPSISEEDISNLFWLNVTVGMLLTTLSVVAAPVLVSFYGEPRLFWITIILGTGFLFNAAGVQHAALLQRRMRFTALAIVEVVSLAASILVGFGLAFSGYGYWALVGMGVSLPLFSSSGVWATAGWTPGRPTFSTGLGSMVRFGGTVSLNGLIVYFAYNVDKLLLGRFAGAETLGLYGRAYQLVSIPTENLHSALSGVALSALSRLQTDADRFRNYFLKGYSLFLSVTVPITIACALFAHDIVAVLLGDKWTQAAPIFRFLTPTILAFALINPVTWLLFATGRVDRSLKMAFVIAPLVIAAYAVGLSYGAVGVAIGFSSMMMLLTVPLVIWAVRDSSVSARDLLHAAKPPLMAAVIATILTLPVMQVTDHLAVFSRLVIEMGALSTTYALSLYYVADQKALLKGVLNDFKQRV